MPRVVRRTVIGSLRHMTSASSPRPAARPILALALCVVSCARPPRVAEPPAPLPPPVIVPADTAPPPPDTMVSYRIPAFRSEPLIAWGPMPAGEPREERRRSYDLQHQDTRIRFDWTRRAVVGSTTIRIAAAQQRFKFRQFFALLLQASGCFPKNRVQFCLGRG